MCSRDFGFWVSAKHARDLVDAIASLEDGNVRGGDATLCSLGYDNVVVGSSCNLRQVRDRKDLMLTGNAAQRIADL